MRWLLIFCLGMCVWPFPVRAAENSKAVAEQAWLDFLKAAELPGPPKEWKGTTPTAKEITEFKGKLAENADEAASLARKFREKFPEHRKRKEALIRECRLLAVADYFGRTNAAARLAESKGLLRKENPDEDERFASEAGAPAQLEYLLRANPNVVSVEAVEKAVRKLLSQFPKYADGYAWLADLAGDYYSSDNFKKAAAIGKEVLEADAPESADNDVKAMLKKIDRIGQPLTVAFTAFDQRKVDLEKWKGKVVLLQGWATWCPLCMEEMPVVKAAYKKLHSAGFEIIGLNFDSDKELLSKFLTGEKEVVWPHHFDGKGWNNKYGEEFEISSLPVLWLVDKHGVLRELNGQNDLEGKVKKLLAE